MNRLSSHQLKVWVGGACERAVFKGTTHFKYPVHPNSFPLVLKRMFKVFRGWESRLGLHQDQRPSTSYCGSPLSGPPLILTAQWCCSTVSFHVVTPWKSTPPLQSNLVVVAPLWFTDWLLLAALYLAVVGWTPAEPHLFWTTTLHTDGLTHRIVNSNMSVKSSTLKCCCVRSYHQTTGVALLVTCSTVVGFSPR